jgi:hypothetical protein
MDSFNPLVLSGARELTLRECALAIVNCIVRPLESKRLCRADGRLGRTHKIEMSNDSVR